jgi:hypothetical protein
MTTIVENIFKVNGVIDTSKTVVQNLQTICAASGCWLSYDIAQGKWAVAINTTGTSIASFNDSNIIGGINISSTGLTELYNSVEIEFPHKDIKDRKDYITFSIADVDRYPNEPDNVLELQTDLVNDPIQAAYIASRELKQSRVDKVIEFRTDFSKLGLKAGDLIDITNTPYGYTSKVFRIVSITEDDADDGVLSLSIQALEYDADVYSTTGLERDERFTDTGIITKDKNTATKTSDGTGSASDLSTALLLAGGSSAILSLLANMASGLKSSQGIPSYQTVTVTVTTTALLNSLNAWIAEDYTEDFIAGTFVQTPGFIIPKTTYNLKIEIEMPVGQWNYQTQTGGTQTLVSYVPGTITILYGTLADGSNSSILASKTADWQTSLTSFSLANAGAGYYWIVFQGLPTYDLSKPTPQVYPTEWVQIVPQTNGSGMTTTAYIFDR